MPPAPQKTPITKADESQSTSTKQTRLDSTVSHPVAVEERSIPASDQAAGSEVGEDDELEVNVGDYLRRIPVTVGGKHYPELIAQVVREGKFGWELTCAEGKSWRCPFNMLGQSWSALVEKGTSVNCVV